MAGFSPQFFGEEDQHVVVTTVKRVARVLTHRKMAGGQKYRVPKRPLVKGKIDQNHLKHSKTSGFTFGVTSF